LQRLQGEGGVVFLLDAFGIEWMAWKKTASANFGGAWWGCRHLALGLSCLGPNTQALLQTQASESAGLHAWVFSDLCLGSIDP